jgi:hypothetical protein
MISRDAMISFIKQKHALGESRDVIAASVNEYGGDAALVDEVLAEQQSSLAKATEERDLVHQYLLSRQSVMAGLFAGVATAVLSAAVWAGTAYITEYQIGWVAVLLGCLVGKSIRRFGQGSDIRFRVMGVLASLAGIFLGNALIILFMMQRMLDVPMADVAQFLGHSEF